MKFKWFRKSKKDKNISNTSEIPALPFPDIVIPNKVTEWKSERNTMISAEEAKKRTIDKILNMDINEETERAIKHINECILKSNTLDWKYCILGKEDLDYIKRYYNALGYKIKIGSRVIIIEWR